MKTRNIANLIDSLKAGILNPFLNLVNLDNTLDFQIRNNYFNIYYRGGSLFKVSNIKGVYYIKFEIKYLSKANQTNYKFPGINPTKSPIMSMQDANDWINAVPFLKHQMDLWFGKHNKNEREFQQVVARENNYSNVTKGSDYFILDIEYQTTRDKTTSRFDLIACKWPSTSSARKKTNNLGLAFIEMKYGDNALKGKAGIFDHINKLHNTFKDPEFLINIKEELKHVYNQKHSLGLIKNQNQITGFNNSKPEYILLITNHDPASKKLLNELNDLIRNNIYQQVSQYVDIKISTANFHGYNLYNECIFGLEEFMSRFIKQI